MLKYITLDDVPLDSEYYTYIQDLIYTEPVLQMKQYIQHGTTTTFDHCLNVSYYNYLVCKRFNLDAKAGARAGMLHDLFLYDWHNYPIKKWDRLRHGATHPKRAYNNACKHFELTPLEKDIICKHMFPMTMALPKYKETIVIILVDKYCGLMETVIPRMVAIKNALTLRKHRHGIAIENSKAQTLYIEGSKHSE
ncbi:MAG: HD family phosphohydrolase [Ruminococcus sp.]|nr:HD family phosphohydrolase [Ruminococcus sp.]MCD7800445.1 HD family phosphohydrolase [Ruminococcus sp.]